MVLYSLAFTGSRVDDATPPPDMNMYVRAAMGFAFTIIIIVCLSSSVR